MLTDISHEDNGLYQCTVANHVGYSVCVVEVKVSGRYGGRGPWATRLGGSGLCFGAPAGSAFPLSLVPRAAGKPGRRCKPKP